MTHKIFHDMKEDFFFLHANIQLIPMRPYLHTYNILEMQASDPQRRHRTLPVPSLVGLMLRCFGVQNKASQNTLHGCWLMAQQFLEMHLDK